jgi:hypothetical protein
VVSAEAVELWTLIHEFTDCVQNFIADRRFHGYYRLGLFKDLQIGFRAGFAVFYAYEECLRDFFFSAGMLKKVGGGLVQKTPPNYLVWVQIPSFGLNQRQMAPRISTL